MSTHPCKCTECYRDGGGCARGIHKSIELCTGCLMGNDHFSRLKQKRLREGGSWPRSSANVLGDEVNGVGNDPRLGMTNPPIDGWIFPPAYAMKSHFFVNGLSLCMDGHWTLTADEAKDRPRTFDDDDGGNCLTCKRLKQRLAAS